MQGKLWGNEYRTTIVCVDQFERSVLAGRLYNPSMEEGETFYGTLDFLRKMEALLDKMQFPQSFTAHRSFQTLVERPVEDVAGSQARRGKLATFAVRVIFRYNSSWQGSVIWQERGMDDGFRSVLELLLLMDNALNIAGPAPDTPEK